MRRTRKIARGPAKQDPGCAGNRCRCPTRAKDRKDLVEIRVDPYPNPISYKGEYHVRSGSTKQELKGAALDRFLMRRYGRTWDSAPVPGVTMRQLSPTAISSFRELAGQSDRVDASDLRGSREKLLEKLRLIEGTYLTRAAVLLFHPDPENTSAGLISGLVTSKTRETFSITT